MRSGKPLAGSALRADAARRASACLQPEETPMLRALACALALSAMACSAHAQELNFSVIQETLSLTKADILEAEQSFADGRPIVRIKFGPAAAARFGEITSRNVGKVLQVAVGDRILTAPVIRSAITGGEVIIEGGFTVEQAVELAKKLKP